MRHSWPFKGDRCDRAFLVGCSAILLLHLENPRILRKFAATRVARQGVPAHVCNYVTGLEMTGFRCSQSIIERAFCFGTPQTGRLLRGKLLYLQLEFLHLQLSFFAYSLLTCFLDTLCHCKQRNSIVSKKVEL